MSYMLATVQVRYGKIAQFSEIMKQMIPVVESKGWRLVSAYMVSVGRFYKVYDLWEIRDANSYGSVIAALAKDADFLKCAEHLGECVESEQVELMELAPFMS